MDVKTFLIRFEFIAVGTICNKRHLFFVLGIISKQKIYIQALLKLFEWKTNFKLNFKRFVKKTFSSFFIALSEKL